MTLEEQVFGLITDPKLTYRERIIELSKAAADVLHPFTFTEETQKLIEENVIFTMFEGNAPFRPRYCVPDYPLFMKQGSEFLQLEPPTDIWTAIGNLMCLYHNMTGAGALPVYAGCLDELLDPFIQDEAEARKAIRILLEHMDATNGDAFFHADLSGHDNRAARLLLEVSAEMQRPCPNMTMLYRQDTPDELAIAAIRAGFACSKPSFANDAMYRADDGDYAVVSCYNTLPIGGSGMTLVRLNMQYLPRLASSEEDLLERVIPMVTRSMCEVIDQRTRFMVDTCRYYENTFLYREGLIHKDRDHMVGMFGYVGLAECVNGIRHAAELSDKYGHSEEADALAEAIMEKIHQGIQAYVPKYGKIQLHAQVGVMEDKDCSPGGRIPIGDEPELFPHLLHFARMHRYCEAGCGDIYPFDETAQKNPEAVLDIIKGAFAVGVRYFSFYSSDADVVRITGYLVKKSDIEKYSRGEQTLHDATVLGKGITEGLGLLNRKVNAVE